MFREISAKGRPKEPVPYSDPVEIGGRLVPHRRAGVAIKYDPVLLEKYKAVVSHSGSSKIAIVAVARKLAMKLRAMLLNGESYEIGLVEQIKSKRLSGKKR